jgi:hypothetical protein
MKNKSSSITLLLLNVHEHQSAKVLLENNRIPPDAAIYRFSANKLSGTSYIYRGVLFDCHLLLDFLGLHPHQKSGEGNHRIIAVPGRVGEKLIVSLSPILIPQVSAKGDHETVFTQSVTFSRI